MQRKFQNFIFLIFLFCSAGVYSQDTLSLSLSESLEAALKNNYSIRIFRNDLQVADNNNSFGNAGMLPSLDVGAGITKANVKTNQEYSNGNIVKQNGAVTDGISAGAHFNWVLFDGLTMFASKSRLGAEEDSYGIRLKMQIETTVALVMQNYFKAVSIFQDIKVTEDAIAMFDERVRIAEMRFQVGAGSKLDLLQSQTDRNARKSLRLQLLVEYDNALSELNQLMGKSEFTEWILTDSITTNYHPALEDLKKSVSQNNYELQFNRKQEEVYKQIVNEARGYRYPLLNLNVDYNYTRTDNEVGFVLLNQNQGLYSGLTLSWNLFNGRNVNREIQNAKLNLNSTNLLLEDTRVKIDQQLYVTYKQYAGQLEILDLESENSAVATENVNIALESFRLGSISGLELKDAQNSFEGAQLRLVMARYNAKLSEIELMRLNGELVK